MNQAVTQTSYYTIANIIRHMSSLVMLPIYTRYLTPRDYGIIELMIMVLEIVGILFCNRVGAAIFRYYSMANSSAEKTQTMSTAFILLVFINSLAFILLLSLSKPISSFINPDPDFHRIFILFAVTLIFEATINVSIIYLRIKNLASYYLAFSTFKLATQIALNLYFVVWLDLHVAGVVYSALITNIILGVVLSGHFISETGLKFNVTIAKKIIFFSIPMIFVTSASFVNTFGDRYFLKVYTTLEDVGIYSLAYKFGFLFMALSWDPFYKYWEGQRYQVIKSADPQSQFAKSFIYLTIWLCALGLLISVFLSDLLLILSDEGFHGAAQIAPLIILAFIFYAWGGYCEFGIYLKEKTKYMAYTEVFSAVIILLLYMFFIPKYGVLGAATATALGYFVRFIVTTALSFSFYYMRLPWLRASCMVACCVLATRLISFENLAIYYSIPAKGLSILGVFAMIYTSPLITRTERGEINQTASMFMAKFQALLQRA
jgi:O-antigen/teichoic acid export membrane protein